MADISWIEILIAISISIILIFVGCLVLGLHVHHIKKKINDNKTSIDSSIKKIHDENTITNSNYINAFNQINSNINLFSKSNTDLSKQLSSLSNVGLSNITNVDAQIKMVNDTIAKLQNGGAKFTSIAIEDSYIKVAKDTINIGGKNKIFMDTQKLYLNSNSCLLIGSNEICSTSNDLVFNVKNSRINMSTSNNILQLKNEKGSPFQIESSGIIQKNKGPMMEYKGNGIGKFNDGMRVYIPGNILKNKIALSYYENNEFTDILSAEKGAIGGKNDVVNIMGDVVIKGNIYNSNMAEFVEQISTEITQLKNQNIEMQQNILKLQLNETM